MKAAKPFVLMIATRDTKWREADYIRKELEERGVKVIHMDPSIRGEDDGPAEIGPRKIAAAAGKTMDEVRALNHEGESLSVMIDGAIKCSLAVDQQVFLGGIIGIGGAMGTALCTAVMRSFRYGLPKLMVSTLASGLTTPFVGSSDIMMMNPVCDISGFNSISTGAYRNSAIAIAAQAREYRGDVNENRPLAMITTLSTIDPCTVRVRCALEEMGCEVMVFHTIGSGGAAMEEIIKQRRVSVVIDVSLVEVNGYLQGGMFSAGAERGMVAVEKEIPVIFAPGNADFMVLGSVDEARRLFPGRHCHVHNGFLTAVRMEQFELIGLAEHMASIMNCAKGQVSFFVPLKGFSEHDSPRGHLYNPLLPPIFSAHLKRCILPNVNFREFGCHINDVEFANAVVAQACCHIFKV